MGIENMESNQREYERRERKNEKKQKKRNAAWIIIILVVVALAALKLSEVDFGKLFDSFGGSGTGISDTVSDDKNFPYKISDDGNTFLSSVGNNLAILNDSVYAVISASNADEKIKDIHGYANPILYVSGGYSVIIDQGANTYRLDSSSDNIYENSVDGEILCADVSDTGVVAIASVAGIHKSNITVYGKSFNQRMNYNVSGGYVTSVAISDSSKYVAFCVISSENAKIKSTVYTMKVGDEQPISKFEYNDSSILDLHFNSDDLYVVGGDFVSVIDSLDEEIPVYAKGSIDTVSFCYNPSDALVIAYGEYAGAQSNVLSYVKPSGQIKSQVEIPSQIKDVAASGTEMTALTPSEAISFKLKNGKESGRFPVDDSYIQIWQMSSKIFGRRSSTIEIINN